MKTVLLIAYYYPPLGGMGTQRALKWARYLKDFGWHTIVLTPTRGVSYVDTTLDDGTSYGVEVVRTPIRHLNPLRPKALGLAQSPAQSPAQAMARLATPAAITKRSALRSRARDFARSWLYIPDGQNGWYGPAVRAGDALWNGRSIDAIVSTSFPVTAHFIASKLKERHPVPWIADYRDLWTKNQCDDFYTSGNRQKLDQWLERRLLQNADIVTTVSHHQASALRLVTNNAKPVEVIRNGFDEEDFQGLSAAAPDKWTLTFVGTYYSFYEPSPLFRTLSRLFQNGRMDQSKARFRVVGEPHPELIALLQKFGLEDITEFTGLVSFQLALSYQVQASLLLLLVPRDRSNPGIIPGKVFEYLGARRPILALSPPEFEAAQIVVESESGTVVEPDDEAGIEACLLASYAAFRGGENPRTSPHDIARYSRREGARQLAALLDGLTA